jgi:hypothetical protein
MTTQIKRVAAHDTIRSFVVVSTFGFWAVLLGFVPVAAIHLLTA